MNRLVRSAFVPAVLRLQALKTLGNLQENASHAPSSCGQIRSSTLE